MNKQEVDSRYYILLRAAAGALAASFMFGLLAWGGYELDLHWLNRAAGVLFLVCFGLVFSISAVASVYAFSRLIQKRKSNN
jgi:hypothetical protein